jgi:Cysteine-rich CWC
MGVAERRIACERCGAAFGCGRDSAAGCWCAAEPYRLPIPVPGKTGAFGDCLCPSCLRALARKPAADHPPGAATR